MTDLFEKDAEQHNGGQSGVPNSERQTPESDARSQGSASPVPQATLPLRRSRPATEKKESQPPLHTILQGMFILILPLLQRMLTQL